MIYNSSIYLSDNILFYKKNDQIINLSFECDIVYGLNRNIFIKKYQQFLKNNKISLFVYNKNLLIIYDSTLSKHDLNYVKKLFYEIGYKNILTKSDISYLLLNKKNSYLIIGKKDKFIYIDNYNEKKQIIFNKNAITFSEELYIIKKRIKQSNLIIIGLINENYINSCNYYIIEKKANYFLAN